MAPVVCFGVSQGNELCKGYSCDNWILEIYIADSLCIFRNSPDSAFMWKDNPFSSDTHTLFSFFLTPLFLPPVGVIDAMTEGPSKYLFAHMVLTSVRKIILLIMMLANGQFLTYPPAVVPPEMAVVPGILESRAVKNHVHACGHHRDSNSHLCICKAGTLASAPSQDLFPYTDRITAMLFVSV